MGGKSTPDFGDVAAAQGIDNRKVVRDQLYANRPDQYTPWGYTNWTSEQIPDGQGGYTDRWSQTQGLSPEAQQQYDQQMAIGLGKGEVAGNLVGRMGSEFGAPVDWGGLSPMGGVPEAQYTRSEDVQTELGDPTAMRQRSEDALYNKGASRLTPQFEAKRQGLEQQMRNQGLGPEDEAWQSRMEGLDTQETDAYGQLQNQAILGGQGEQAQAWNQGLQGGQFYNQGNQQTFGQNMQANQQNFGQGMNQSAYSNQIRQQQMTEEMQKRGFSLNEINALMSGQQVQNPQMPNFAQGAAAAPPPTYQGAVDQSNADQAASPWAGLGSLAGTLGAAYLGAPVKPT